MTMPNAQKSEVHDVTEDSSTSPTGAAPPKGAPIGSAPSKTTPKRDLPPLQGDLRVVSDDTESGGPLVLQSDDPALQKLDLPKEEFPTDRTPEIDPPVEK